MTTTNRLYKSSREKMLFGVAGGLAEYFDVDPVLVRIVFVILAFAGGAGLWIYIALAIIMPKAKPPSNQGAGASGEGLEGGSQETSEAALVTPTPEEEDRRRSVRGRRRKGLAIALIVIGGVLLLMNLEVFSWLDWGTLWPVIPIAIGVGMLYGWSRRA